MNSELPSAQVHGRETWYPKSGLYVRDGALAVLNAVAAMASTTLDVDEVLRRALALALEVVGVEAGAISVLDEATNELVFRVQQGWRVHDFVAQGVRVPADQGLSGTVVATGQPIVTGDVSRDLRVAVLEFCEEGTQAMALAPMRARGRVLGVLGVMHYTPREFSSEEVTVVSAVADQIGIALDNARLLEESRCRAEEMSALQATGVEVSSTLDLWAALETIASSALGLTGAAVVELHLYEDANDRLVFATALHKDGGQAPVSAPPLGDGPIARVARSGKVVMLEDLASESGVDEWQARGTEVLVALPLKRAARVLGVLVAAFDAPRSFSDHELRVLSLLTDQAAIAVERTRLFARETRRSTHLALINQVARQATATLNLSEILDTAAAAIWSSFAYFNVALFLIDEATQEVVLHSIAGGYATKVEKGYCQAVGEGIVGRVADTGQSMLVNDVAQEPYYRPLSPTTDPVSSELAVPIMRGDEVIGILDIRHLERGGFDQEDVRAMEMLADQLAVAIENSRLYGETRRRVAELTAVQETSLRVVSSLDISAVLDTVARNALELVDADDVHIFLQDGEGGDLVFGTAAWRDASLAMSREKRPDRFTWAVLESSRSLVINHAREHPHFSSPQAQGSGVEAVAGFPLLGADGVVGVMNVVYLRPHAFSEDELRVLGLLASQAAVAISNANLYEETRRRLEELTVLHEVALAATSTMALEEIADRVTTVVREGLGCEHVHLLLLDEERALLECVGCDGVEKSLCELHVGPGLASWVAEHAQPLRVGDVSQDQRYIEKVAGVCSELIVPLVVGDHVIGVIDAASLRCDAFDAGDEHLLTTVARQLAVAIENARLYRETERRLVEVSALYQLARQITSLDVQDVLDSIVRVLKQAIGCRGCSIALLDPINNVLEIRAAAGIEDRWKRDFRLRLGEGIAGRVALEGSPIYVPDALEMEDFVFFSSSLRSLLTVPLSIQDKVIGTLSVDSEQAEAFSEADERLLTIAASQAAIAIENARLYARLEQRARNLAEAYAELQEADRFKDEMVQNISHELRTPLTFVRGYVELLLSGEAGALSDRQSEYLKIVTEKTTAVTRLVSDIMFFQQADRVSGKATSISLTKLARRALRGCAATAEEMGLTLVVDFADDLPPVVGDEGRLLQVFDNLLNNAIKFSPAGGQVAVTIEDAGTALQVSVTDQGIGIPKDKQARIFERFYQVDGSAQRRFGGIGLGLAIAKRIVESHDGRIWVESEPEQGSSFRFTIPKYGMARRG